MTQRLEGKSAVVTGSGSGGIGEAVALALAAEGAKVVVNDIDRDPDGTSTADKVVEEITKASGTAVANYDSVATMQGGENIIKTAISNFGRIDILVNCAGNFMPARSFEITEEQWDSIINVHLKGHFSCAKAAILEMIQQKSGRIINISSRAASGGGGNPAYNAAKAGILGFTSMLAGDLKEFGIAVNAVLPSADTRLFPGKGPRLIGDNMPVPLWMEPDYVPPIIVYLATDEAQNITGRYFYASGGDICIYAKPLQLPGAAHIFIRKMGKLQPCPLATCLSRLQTDYIDLYYAHMPDRDTPIEETMRAFDDLVHQGKVRYIGFSNFTAWQLCKALWVSDLHNLARFECIEPPYNLLTRDIEIELLPLCASEGVGVCVFNPLAGEMLTGRHEFGKPPAEGRFTLEGMGPMYLQRYWSEINFKAVDRLKQVAKGHGCSLPQFALAWILSNETITSALSGSISVEQLEENLGALEIKLSQEELQACDDVWTMFRPPRFFYARD